MPLSSSKRVYFYSLGFYPSFSRHGIVQVNLTLLIWLNENVPVFIILQGLTGVLSHHTNFYNDDKVF